VIAAWLDGYEHQPVIGAGLPVGPGRDKIVLHTTETAAPSLQTLVASWRRNWGAGLPHFIAEGGRYVQLLPLTVNAYTMENHAGGADVNKAGHVIQVEIVGYARNELTDQEYGALGRWVGDLINAGLAIDLDGCPHFYGANDGIVLASYTSPIRLGARAWTEASGILGHQHAPENAHWDPGHVDIERVCRLACTVTTNQEAAHVLTQEDWDRMQRIVEAGVARGIEASVNIEGNLAGVTRDEGGQTRTAGVADGDVTRQLITDLDHNKLVELEAVQTNLAGVLREFKDAGALAGDFDVATVAERVAASLGVVVKSPPA
jgi:hypothetical protein